ncbi:hypothetical protein [Yersinia pseudotuberculosis]|uniref:hypothetical protein n=1 Tax=Yersinia pseudotuberculosis TaxID=633 RepID=UPI0030C8C216
MKPKIHPAVSILKRQIATENIPYDVVAERTSINANRFKNIISGRIRMTMEERDDVCEAIGLSPIDLVLRRTDLKDREHIIDIRELPTGTQNAIRILCSKLILEARSHTKKRAHRK